MRIPLGPLIVSIFAIVWVSVGTRGFSRPAFFAMFAAAVAISLGLVFACGRWGTYGMMAFNARAYELAVGFEVLGILCAIVYAKTTGRKDLILPLISIVVGLHFFGLVWALDSSLYWWVGGAMCALPILSLALLPRSEWQATIGIGCALILWLSTLGAFF